MNAKKQSIFADRVTMYVYEEIVDGRKLTEIINETHENVKYLPGHKIPENVVSCSPRRFAYLKVVALYQVYLQALPPS
jgi:glycerol-3-phosphate dehydrogenase